MMRERAEADPARQVGRAARPSPFAEAAAVDGGGVYAAKSSAPEGRLERRRRGAWTTGPAG